MNPFKLLVLLFCCLSLPGFAIQQVDTIYYNRDWNETRSKDSIAYYRILSKKEGLYYAKDYFLSGQLQMEGVYKSFDPDVMHGYFKVYDSLGYPLEEGEFADNKKEGKWQQYIPNRNQVGIIYYCKNHKFHGPTYVYDGQGKKQWVDSFVNGIKVKRVEYFRGNDREKSIIEYSNDVPHGVVKLYDSASGKILKLTSMKNGKMNGRMTIFYRGTDNIKDIYDYVNDSLDGNSVRYDSLTQKIIFESMHRNGRRHGRSVLYDPVTGYKTSEGYSSNGVDSGNRIYYYPGTTQPRKIAKSGGEKLTGPCTEFYLSGNKSAEGMLEQSGKVGDWIFYFDKNGLVKSTRTFNNSKANGLSKYYDSTTGKLKSEGSYGNGVKTGTWKYYFPESGKLDGIENFKGGELHGEKIDYYPSGAKKEVSRYQDGIEVGNSFGYYENGNIRSEEKFETFERSYMVLYDSASGKMLAKGERLNSKRDGLWTFYYPGTEVVKIKENFKDGLYNGEYSVYHTEGQKWIIGAHNEGKKVGKWKYYYPSGKEWMTLSYENGVLDGDLHSYHENGTLKRKEKRVNGALIIAKCFNEHGDEIPFFPVFVNAQYEGDISTFVGRELQYPESAEQSRVEGKVTVGFIVNEDGSLSDFTIVKSLSPDCDKEALRIVSKMDKWIPAQLDGQGLREPVTVPVVFWLRDSEGE